MRVGEKEESDTNEQPGAPHQVQRVEHHAQLLPSLDRNKACSESAPVSEEEWSEEEGGEEVQSR